MAEQGINISPETIAAWKREKADLEQQFQKLQAKLALVVRNLNAAEVLAMAAGGALGTPAPVTPEASLAATRSAVVHAAVVSANLRRHATYYGGGSDDSPPTDEDPGNMTLAIERLANESQQPMTKKEMKRRLVDEGFAASRLTSYFYTPIKRLKDQNRISILPDGRIWRAPQVEVLRSHSA
jgi:hypothetical protein